jgi:hypothetical protein
MTTKTIECPPAMLADILLRLGRTDISRPGLADEEAWEVEVIDE